MNKLYEETNRLLVNLSENNQPTVEIELDDEELKLLHKIYITKKKVFDRLK